MTRERLESLTDVVDFTTLFSTLYQENVGQINVIINTKRSSSLIDKLQLKGKTLQQPASISNALNTYFCNVPIVPAFKLPDRRISSYT